MKRFFMIIALAAAVSIGWWYASGGISSSLNDLERLTGDATSTLQEAAKDVVAPPPLRAAQEAQAAKLTAEGVLKWTNVQRHDNGALPPLAVNDQLVAGATAKMNDLFAKQYFEHISPSGIGPGDVADAAGYAYAVIGENLALGNFADDQALVQAWMDSPGHRANILGASYKEIGIAVGQGTYEGRKTWIAVQEFGKPKAACAMLDAALHAQIDADETSIRGLETDAQRLKSELDAAGKPGTRDARDAYNRNVDAYNTLVRRINVLNQQIQGEITVYNGQVQAYNACTNS